MEQITDIHKSIEFINNAVTASMAMFEEMEQATSAFVIATNSVGGVIELLHNISIERNVLYRIIIGLLLDTGLYDYEIDQSYLNELKDYNLIITTDETKSKLSVQAPNKDK